MKTISRLLLILSLALSWVVGNADNISDPLRWRQDVLRSEAPLVEMPDIALERLDFGHIFMDGRTDYLGYIGEDYQRLRICFNTIEKVSSTEYSVTGYSEVRSNRCDFSGTIEIEALYEKTELDFGVDNWMDGKVKQQGIVVANFSFAENREQQGSGEFNGCLITKWYIDTDGRLLYDDIEEDSDDYSNNRFLGRWTSYRTNVSKQCAWGQYRIPCSGDLDIGAAEFSVNHKYLDNGWGTSSRESLLITAYTPFNGQITDDSSITDEGTSYYDGEWTEITPDSRISMGWSEDVRVGLCERLELGKDWLCVDFPRYPESAAGIHPQSLQTGKTATHAEDWLGDPFTVLEGVKGDFDIGFRELQADDFRYLEQEAVEDRAECERINDRISEAIRNGEITSYRNPDDTMNMRSLNSFSFGRRRLLAANYNTVQGDCDFVSIIENDNAIQLTGSHTVYCELHFFTLNDGKVYMFSIEQRYAGVLTKIVQLDPETASRDKTVFMFSKSTD